MRRDSSSSSVINPSNPAAVMRRAVVALTPLNIGFLKNGVKFGAQRKEHADEQRQRTFLLSSVRQRHVGDLLGERADVPRQPGGAKPPQHAQRRDQAHVCIIHIRLPYTSILIMRRIINQPTRINSATTPTHTAPVRDWKKGTIMPGFTIDIAAAIITGISDTMIP